MAGRRIAAGLAALSLSAGLFGAAAGDGMRSLLGIERRALAGETRRLADLSRRLDSAANDLTAASRGLADAAGRSDSALAAASDAFTRALASVNAAAFDQRLSLERIRLLRERVGDLEREAAAGRTEQEDPLTGDWRIRVDPGAQEGDLHLSLDGTIVTGSYSLEGGFTGSVRGTFVGDTVKIDRIDSRLGFLAVYYGRLMPDGVTITGTWEGTELNNAGPTSGTWTAARKPEPEEAP